MTLHQLSSHLKDTARGQLPGHYGDSILLTIIYNVIIYALSMLITMPVTMVITIMTMTSDTTVELGIGYTLIMTLLTSVMSIFAGVMQTGISLFYLNLACGRTTAVSNLFYGYRYLFKQSLALSAVMVIINTVTMLPYSICNTQFQTDGTTESALLMIFWYAVGTLIYVPVSLAISQCFYLLLDFPRYSAKQLLHLSIRIMKGNKRKLFYIELSFLPLILLSLLSFGIGNLWLTPYMQLTMAFFFLEIMKSGKH